MVLQGLKNIGGDLNCAGNKQLNENSFPSLEFIGGDIILSGANFKILPKSLIEVKGRGILSKSDPISLLESMRKAEAEGIIKGGIFLND